MKIPLLQHKTRPINNSTILGYCDRPFSQYPYGWKWFAQGINYRPGFMTELTLGTDLNCVVPAEKEFTTFINRYLTYNNEITLKPSYCS